MTPKVLMTYLLGFIVSGALGWYFYSPKPAVPVSDEDTWRVFEDKLSSASQKNDYEDQILSSGLIYLPETDTTDTPGLAEDTIPRFPEIRSVSIIDNVAQIHLRDEDDNKITAKAGDILDSGWELKSIDLRGVIAVYGEEERIFNAVDYDISRKPTDESQDVGTTE